MQHLVYLHGFLSSPQSVKAQQTAQYLKKHFPSINLHMPQLPGDINKAVAIVDALVSKLPTSNLAFIGSSMGGFLASYCIEKYGGKGVLVNPAVEPYHLFEDYLGAHVNPNTLERFYLTHQHIDTLKRIDTKVLKDPHRYFIMLQTGDETLDFRLAANKYRNAKLLIEHGGDHSFVDYQTHLPDIFKFLR